MSTFGQLTDTPSSQPAATPAPNRRSGYSLALAIPIAAALLYLSLRGVDWRRVWQGIAGADWRFIALAAAITMLSSFVRSQRWRILLNAEASIGMVTVFWATMAGYLGNNFLPARAGELIRTVLISTRSSLTTAYVLTTALSERLMDVIVLVLWSSLLLLGVKPKPVWVDEVSRTMAIVAAIGAVIIIVLPHTGHLLEAAVPRLPVPAAARRVLLDIAHQVLLGMRALHDWRRFACFVSLTALIWALDALMTMVLAHALGLTIPFSVAILLLAALGLSSAIPSTPGYVGVYQFVAVTVLVPFGITRDGALAYVLVFQALGYAVVTAFGVPGLYRLQGTVSLREVARGTISTVKRCAQS